MVVPIPKDSNTIKRTVILFLGVFHPLFNSPGWASPILRIGFCGLIAFIDAEVVDYQPPGGVHFQVANYGLD